MPGQSTRKVDGGRIPGPAAVPSCVEIRWIFRMANNKEASVRCFGSHVGGFESSQTVANSFFTALSNAWVTRVGSLMNPGISFQRVTIREMSAITNPEFVSNLTAVPATGTANAMPQDVALALTAEVVERGRGAKGRMYFMGWSTTADGSSGQATTAAQTALNQLGTDISAALSAQGLVPVIAKPARQEYIGLTGATHPARAAHTAQVTGYVCQNTEWDTQRRRGF